MSRVIVVGGGVRSGKSAFAVALAERVGPRRAFVATAQPFDAEMEARIAAHRDERGDRFETVEAPEALPQALTSLADRDVVVVDCLTVWLSNLLLAERTDAEIAAAVDEVAQVCAARRTTVVLVTNEVGMGVVPPSPLGRRFRDVAGRAHQRLARDADEIYLATLGVILRLRPGAVTAVAASGVGS